MVPQPGADPGFQRFGVRVVDFGTLVQLIGYAQLPTGVRLFDHNQLPGDLDSFTLDAQTGFHLPFVPALCPGVPPRATLEFADGFVQVQHGAIRAGGQLEIDYALARLTACRDTHNGYRFWSLDAFVRFQPGGQLSTGSVVGSNGTAIFPQPYAVDVPEGAQSVELWFENATPPSCDAWDSRFGQNYAFPVVSAAPSQVGWAGDWGSSVSRACSHESGVPDPMIIDEYVRERACAFVDADVWVPGATDDGGHPEWVQAQVEWWKDNQPLSDDWLEPIGRVGNNQRFRWTLPYELRNVADWRTAFYTFRFSTDGRTWTTLARPGGAARTIERAFELP
jgi:hypothetical protein